MSYQAVFKRYETKYLLDPKQLAAVLEAIAPYMAPDKYGLTTIRNIYFDTENYRLIRRSIEKPAYKEKLRLRSYSCPSPETPVFVELKKKYEDVVYKRRSAFPLAEALDWICNRTIQKEPTQITREIDYFIDFYSTLHPTVFLSYDRVAYYAKDGSGFRITFDTNIRFRQEDIRLDGDTHGTSILPQDRILMELKCNGGIPLWMTKVLTDNHIYKTAFSKYGTAYQSFIYKQQEAFSNGSTI